MSKLPPPHSLYVAEGFLPDSPTTIGCHCDKKTWHALPPTVDTPEARQAAADLWYETHLGAQ